ncbi:MAG TPA: cytochrome C [Burkholderiaceae bacterium]
MLDFFARRLWRERTRHRHPAQGVLLAVLLAAVFPASAIPVFNRQTGQNCQACHAGGQFPELTPYGRLFKLTGYTIGARPAVPLSAMAVASVSSVRDTHKSDDPAADFPKNDDLLFSSASLFAGGRITDNVGAFLQYTYDPYANRDDSGRFHGHAAADNMDIRYADRFVGAHDLVVGVDVNNNPSVSDPWNTAAAWMQYVPVPSPGSSQFIDGATPYPGYAVGGNTSGLTAYAFLDERLYVEAGAYRTTRGPFAFMKLGQPTAALTRLQGNAPYVRAAYNLQWGASALEFGASTMSSRIYDDPANPGDPATLHRFRDASLDAQYQWLLDPHAATVQLVLTRQHHRYPAFLAGQASPFVDAQGNPLAPSSPSDTLRLVRAKAAYTWRATYGASLSYFDLSGTTNTLNQSSGYDPSTGTITSSPSAQAPSTRVNGNASGNPSTVGETLEAYWLPWQNLRIGLQFTAYQRYNGSARNYDGFGRNASDNDSLFLYAWLAY